MWWWRIKVFLKAGTTQNCDFKWTSKDKKAFILSTGIVFPPFHCPAFGFRLVGKSFNACVVPVLKAYMMFRVRVNLNWGLFTQLVVQWAVQGSSVSPTLLQGPMMVRHRNLDPELVHPDSSGDNLQSPRDKDANHQEPSHDNMSMPFNML